MCNRAYIDIQQPCDFIIPAETGLFDWSRVHELSEVVGRQGPQRESMENITLYKGLGIALEDIAVAAHIWKLAQKQGVGEQLQLSL